MAISYLDNIFNFVDYEYLNPSRNDYGDLVLQDPATTQVVTTDELKAHLRITSTSEDVLLATYISAATQMAEHYCNRHFINARYRLYFLEKLPTKFSLYYPDVTLDTTAGSAADRDGLLYRFPSSNIPSFQISTLNYYVNKNNNPCYVVLVDNLNNVFDELNALDEANYMFRFTTGMGTARTDIPDAIKQAIKLIAGDMYYFREDRKRQFPMASEILLQPYKCYL